MQFSFLREIAMELLIFLSAYLSHVSLKSLILFFPVSGKNKVLG